MEKYLPVGTVCTLDKVNRKYVIMGYFSLEFNSNIKMYDYVGVPYPEGLLLHNKILSFNHDDITKIDFLGYNDEKYDVFNKKILTQSNEVDSIESENGVLYNFTFDENGVVIYEYETPVLEEKKYYTFSENLENPFNKKHDFSNYSNELENKSQTWTIFDKYEFDEKGNVVSDEKIVSEENLNEESESESEYEFDENGVLIVDEK